MLVITGTTAKILVYDIGGNLRYESNKSSWDKYGYNIKWYYSDADYTSNTNAQFRNTDSTSYLGQLSANAMTATSVADATFLVNKNVTVGMSDERNPPAFGNSALIYLKSVNYGRRYSLSLDSKTPNSTEPPVTGYADTNNATTGTSSGTTNNNDLKVSTTLNTLRTRILTSSTATGTDASYSSTQTFASALSNDFINGRLTLQTLTINDATYNADQARLVVTLGDVTIPFNASGIGGWKYASAASTNRQIILPPEYVPQRLNTELMQYYYTRAF